MNITSPQNCLQDFIADSKMKKMLLSNIRSGTLPNVLLIRGPYGCGKSTLAKILYRAIKCGCLSKNDDLCEACREAVPRVRSFNAYYFSFDRKILETFESQVRMSTLFSKAVYIFDEVQAWTEKDFGRLHSILDVVPEDMFLIFTTHSIAGVPQPFRSRCTEIALKPLDRSSARQLIRQTAKRLKTEVLEDDIERIASLGIPREILREVEKVFLLKQ